MKVSGNLFPYFVKVIPTQFSFKSSYPQTSITRFVGFCLLFLGAVWGSTPAVLAQTDSAGMVTVHKALVVEGGPLLKVHTLFTPRPAEGVFTPENYTVQMALDNGWEGQNITLAPAPAHITFLFDASGSMGEAFPKMQEVSTQLLTSQTSPTPVFASIMGFNEVLTTGSSVAFSQNVEQLTNNINSLATENKGTCLYDSAFAAVAQLRQATPLPTPKALVLFTDGYDELITGGIQDPCSLQNIENLINAANLFQIPIYAVGFNSSAGNINSEFLTQLTAATGGQFWEFDAETLPSELGQTLNNLSQQWIVEAEFFTPPGQRALTLYIQDNNGQQLQPDSIVLNVEKDYPLRPAPIIEVGPVIYDGSPYNLTPLSFQIALTPGYTTDLQLKIWAADNPNTTLFTQTLPQFSNTIRLQPDLADELKEGRYVIYVEDLVGWANIAPINFEFTVPAPTPRLDIYPPEWQQSSSNYIVQVGVISPQLVEELTVNIYTSTGEKIETQTAKVEGQDHVKLTLPTENLVTGERYILEATGISSEATALIPDRDEWLFTLPLVITQKPCCFWENWNLYTELDVTFANGQPAPRYNACFVSLNACTEYTSVPEQPDRLLLPIGLTEGLQMIQLEVLSQEERTFTVAEIQLSQWDATLLWLSPWLRNATYLVVALLVLIIAAIIGYLLGRAFAPVREIAAPAVVTVTHSPELQQTLRVWSNDQEVDTRHLKDSWDWNKNYTIGRSADACELAVSSLEISHRQLEIRKVGDNNFMVTNIGQAPVLINDLSLSKGEEGELVPNAQIQIGQDIKLKWE